MSGTAIAIAAVTATERDIVIETVTEILAGSIADEIGIATTGAEENLSAAAIDIRLASISHRTMVTIAIARTRTSKVTRMAC